MLVFVVTYAEGDVLEGTTHWYGNMLLAMIVCWVAQPFPAVVGGAACLRALDHAG